MTAFFSKFSPTLLVGGTYSGQVVLWDIRAKTTPVQQTPLSSIGHTHPVYSMDIVGTKNAHSLVSVSTDGKLCVWSLENLLQPQVLSISYYYYSIYSIFFRFINYLLPFCLIYIYIFISFPIL